MRELLTSISLIKRSVCVILSHTDTRALCLRACSIKKKKGHCAVTVTLHFVLGTKKIKCFCETKHLGDSCHCRASSQYMCVSVHAWCHVDVCRFNLGLVEILADVKTFFFVKIFVQAATVPVESYFSFFFKQVKFSRSRTGVISPLCDTSICGYVVCFICFSLAAAVGDLGWSGLMADLFSGPAELLITRLSLL